MQYYNNENIIADNVNKSKYFFILVDETSDISTTEQLSVCVRYMNDQNILHEDFLQFVVIESLCGVDLATSILNGT